MRHDDDTLYIARAYPYSYTTLQARLAVLQSRDSHMVNGASEVAEEASEVAEEASEVAEEASEVTEEASEVTEEVSGMAEPLALLSVEDSEFRAFIVPADQGSVLASGLRDRVDAFFDISYRLLCFPGFRSPDPLEGAAVFASPNTRET